ncbi:hypothetical protein QYE76_030272 [Lolium multiflorum]|uniref:CCHC-type domain-containing protein n=1 Tax=Lolium multiflorum TaxID=4521 RepID=A0AAD8QSS7_LOLMU|nr:hypothetical protein QYE76_030272 [Lolium multiflorum]
MLLNDKKKRTCYNCDEDSHFANECPYEKRVDKPKFVKGVKPRLKPNPINDRYKKNKGRAFVGAEYMMKKRKMRRRRPEWPVWLSKPGSLFTYDYSKDYSTENDVGSSFMARMTQDDDSDDSLPSTIVGSCLMARETKVMESPPSLTSVLDDESENQEELAMLKELYKVRCTLRGEALVKFDFLMDSLKEKDESIEELEYHLNDKERRFNLLRQELKTERCISQGLKQQIETYELDKVKDLETIERAQSLTQELNASKEELEVAHASLTRDLDHLERSNKLVNDELNKLGENHDLLQETYTKALESMNDPIIDKDVASSSTSFTSEHAKLVAEHVRLQEELSLHVETNTYLESLVTKYGLNYHPNESACEQATILEENFRLKNELAKFTTTKNKMGLDDLLSKQRSNNQKHGLGYVPKLYKKNNYKKEKPAQEKNKKVTNDGKAQKGKATSSDRTGPNNHYALFIDYYGDFYANYVGPRNGYAYREYSIWGYSSGGPNWVFDSGCTNHMTGGRGVLEQFIEDINKKSSITFGDNSKGKVLGYGKMAISKDLCLETVMLVESLGRDNLKLVLVGYVENKLYVVDLSKESPSPSTCLMAAKHDEGKLGKFETRTIEGTFVGYAENSHAYRYYNKSTGTIEVSCDVVFLEDNGSQVEQVVPCVAGNDYDPSSAIKLMGIGHIRPVEVHNDDQDDGIEMSHIPKNKKKALNPLSKIMMMIKKHPQLMFKLKLSLMINFEPLKLDEALVDLDWVIAMQEELEYFTRNEVWPLVERPKDHRINVIGTKWVFKNKQDENGIVIRNKARLVAQGFAQIEELKFFLGFQVRQLAKGTFISQEKYVKDMLKKFDMTNANPMKTPMPVKGQLGSCDGEKDVDIKHLWDDYYNSPECMKNGLIVMPKAINTDALMLHQATKYRFVIDTLKRMGLFDLMCLTPNEGYYCPILVRQFHCTVFFHDDAARTMTWMTGQGKYTCNYLDFCEAMGFGGGRAHGFKIYSQRTLSHGDISFCYPLEPTAGPPTISGMYYSYLVLAKLFRETLISKSGDSSVCHAYHPNLMYHCRPDNQKTIDGCDLLYCELRRSVRERMTPNYAQYVQLLIDKVVQAPYNKKDERVKMEPFKMPKLGDKPEIPSMMPSERRSKEKHDPASSSYSRRPKRGASRFLTSLWQMCKNTNDVAHQSLALSQETRRRQNHFMAARNTPVPPPGPGMEPMHAPTWEMPPIYDEMLQNFDLSMYAHGGLPPRNAPEPETSGYGNNGDEDEDQYDDDDDEEDDDDGSSPAAGTEFY